MDDANGDQESAPGGQELVPRPPGDQDLINLCRRLNELGAKYVVVGGFAVIYAGYGRFTEDLDLIIDVSLSNEAKVFQALESLPDQAVKELKPGEVGRFTVVRVAGEIVVDLMKSACGIDYDQAAKDVVMRNLGGVPIPFASPRLLWKMKAKTRRAKDAPDLVFLREYFRSLGEEPPVV